MEILLGWFDFIADEIFKNGEVSFNRQGLLGHVPAEVLDRECRQRGWELVDAGGNGVRGLTIRPMAGGGGGC